MGEKIRIEKVPFLLVLFLWEAKKRNGKVFILNLLDNNAFPRDLKLFLKKSFSYRLLSMIEIDIYYFTLNHRLPSFFMV